MGLICISQVANDVDDVDMCLLAICISSLGKCLLEYFELQVFFNVLDTSPCYQMYDFQ